MEPIARLEVGTVVVTAVRDRGGRLRAAEFLPGAPPEQLEAPLDLDEDGAVAISFHSFVIESQGTRILVDTCLGDQELPVPSAELAELPRWLVRADLRPDSVDLVVHTHLHYDHVGWNTTLFWPHSSMDRGELVPTFPNARHLVHEREWEYWLGGEPRPIGPDYDRHFKPLVAAGMVERYEDEERQLTPEVTVLLAPGHTPGHIIVRVESESERAYIIGDAMHLPVQVGEPSWSSRADIDPELAAETRASLVARIEEEQALLLSGHFPFPGWGHVVADADGATDFRAL